MKLGLCCLRAAPTAPRMRTMTRKKFLAIGGQDAAQDILLEIVLHNISVTKQNIHFCADNGIAHYRISSALMPLITLNCDSYNEFFAGINDRIKIFEALRSIGGVAYERNITLSTHPDQYVCLGSPNADVRRNSIREFNFQAALMATIGETYGMPIPMCLHVSNGTQKPTDTAMRFLDSYDELNLFAQLNICLENEDKGCWTPDNLLAYFSPFKLVYDNWHHHLNSGNLTPQQAVREFKNTWLHYSGPTTFHWSEGSNSDSRSHADEFSFLPEVVKDNPDVVWECEVKNKELAIKKAQLLLDSPIGV